MNFRILHRDESLVAVDKPAGFHVHPPEDESHRISNSRNSLFLLRKQLGEYLYPVHRLDRATSGVLLFALNASTATSLSELFRSRKIRKTYYAVVRGWTELEGIIDHPLKAELPATDRKEATTSYWRVAQIELPFAVGRYPTARYSLVRVEPHTGRMHQIRRHFAGISHPLIGDTIYGSGEHNRFFRQQLGISGLLLKAYALEFTHPTSGLPLRIQSRWQSLWHQCFAALGACPFSAPGFHPGPKERD